MPPTARVIFILTVIIFIILIICSILIIDRGIKPTLMHIAEEKTIEFATRTINAAVKSTENIAFDNLVDIAYDNDDNVSVLGWNSAAVNQALRLATERAEYFLYQGDSAGTLPEELLSEEEEKQEDSPIIVEIPIGMATGSTILANLGPKIPVHFEIVGSLRTDIVHEVKEFGVNAALFEIYIPVSVNVQIIIPFSTTTTEISTNVFIDSRVVMGKVPEFYQSGGSQGGGPSISIPKDNISR